SPGFFFNSILSINYKRYYSKKNYKHTHWYENGFHFTFYTPSLSGNINNAHPNNKINTIPLSTKSNL
ncbi:MAG: hypothetical protein AB1414_21345, partial [bacterium]